MKYQRTDKDLGQKGVLNVNHAFADLEDLVHPVIIVVGFIAVFVVFCVVLPVAIVAALIIFAG